MSRINFIEPGAVTMSAADLALVEKLIIPGIPGLTVAAARLIGFRYLSDTYTGPLFRVRRSSDNTELDCTTIAQMLAFVGTGSGYLRTWYDQSGFGRHYQQPVAAAQFALVQGGVQVTLNGRQSAAMDNVDDYMVSTVTGAYAAGGSSFFVVFEATAATTIGRGLMNEARSAAGTRYTPVHAVTGGTFSQYGRNDPGTVYLPAGTVAEAPAAFVSGTPRQLSFVDNGTTVRKRVNRTQLADVAYTRAGANTFDQALLNGQISSGSISQFMGGKISEIIEFWSPLSNANRDAVESSIANTYPATAA